MIKFIQNKFIGFGYSTVEGGEFRILVAPVSKNDEYVAFTFANLLSDRTNEQVLFHLTQKEAANFFYQMNMFLDIFDNPKMDESLLSEVQSETIKKFNTIDKVDIRCDCGGELKIL